MITNVAGTKVVAMGFDDFLKALQTTTTVMNYLAEIPRGGYPVRVIFEDMASGATTEIDALYESQHPGPRLTIRIEGGGKSFSTRTKIPDGANHRNWARILSFAVEAMVHAAYRTYVRRDVPGNFILEFATP